ncbi:MAG: PHP domain-containing protein [Dethiobacteria bacterium]
MVMKRVDLHIHTTFSDGSLNPVQVVKTAKEKGIVAVGITDHDTLEGIAPAETAGKSYGVEIIPGVELSTSKGEKEFHLLGYFCDPQNHRLKNFLEQMAASRHERIKKMITKLGELGVEIDLAEILAQTQGKAPGRPHLALALYRKGYCHTPAEAFEKYIGKGCPAYIKRYKLDFFQAIDLVRGAGGIPVLAHPGIYGEDRLIPGMVAEGLMGIEVFHPDHRSVDENNYLKIAQKHKLLVTGGSDYHGEGIGSAPAIGTVTIDYHYLKKLKNMA